MKLFLSRFVFALSYPVSDDETSQKHQSNIKERWRRPSDNGASDGVDGRYEEANSTDGGHKEGER